MWLESREIFRLVQYFLFFIKAGRSSRNSYMLFSQPYYSPVEQCYAKLLIKQCEMSIVLAATTDFLSLFRMYFPL